MVYELPLAVLAPPDTPLEVAKAEVKGLGLHLGLFQDPREHVAAPDGV